MDFLLTAEEKKKLIDIELREDYYDLWGNKGIIAFIIPLVVFIFPLTILIEQGANEHFIKAFKLSFIVYGILAYLIKAIEIAVRKYVYKKRRQKLKCLPCEDERFYLEIRNSTIFLYGEKDHKAIKMSEIIDVIETDGYLAICYGEYGEYIFIPLKEFKVGSLYNLLASINKNLK